MVLLKHRVMHAAVLDQIKVIIVISQRIAVKPSVIAPPVFKRRVSRLSVEYIDRCVHMSTLQGCSSPSNNGKAKLFSKKESLKISEYRFCFNMLFSIKMSNQ